MAGRRLSRNKHTAVHNGTQTWDLMLCSQARYLSALGVSHVMRYINLRYLLTYLLLY